MGYYENDKYDIFIAYYGNAVQGSERKAREIYDYINGAKIGPNKYIHAYFHPAVNPYGNFDETPMIVARTPMFLLVADKNIPTSGDGQLHSDQLFAYGTDRTYAAHGVAHLDGANLMLDTLSIDIYVAGTSLRIEAE